MEKELVQEFVQVMLKLLNKELTRKKFAQYKSAKVVSINTNGSVNIKIPPSETIIHNILNKTGETLSENDDVSLLLKDGTMSTALVAFKNKTNLIYNGSGGGSSLTEDILNKINSAIQAIKVNNTLLNPNINQEVNINMPTKLTDLTNDGHFVRDPNYIHTDNNLTNSLLDKINSGIQGIKVNDTLLSLNNNQEVNIEVPTNLTELINDGNFVQDSNYIHTDNNLTNTLKKSYDNLVTNVNQTVNSNNKLATMNDIPTIDLSNYYNKEETNNRYVQKETGKGLSTNDFTNAEKTKLAGISINANKVEKSNINGNIKVNGKEINVYTKPDLTKSEVITALGYIPTEGGTANLDNYYDKQQSDNRYVKIEEIFDKIYPIGSIYISVTSINPSTIFGGIWEPIEDKFLLSAGNTYVAGITGGNETHSHTQSSTTSSHTLTIEEIPVHSHSVGEHSHGLNSHTHTYSKSSTTSDSTTLTAAQSGCPAHNHKLPVGFASNEAKGYGAVSSAAFIDRLVVSGDGSNSHNSNAKNATQGHTHSITLTTTNSGSASGVTANSKVFNTGVTGDTKGHTHFLEETNSASSLPPYLVVYVWKRTA